MEFVEELLICELELYEIEKKLKNIKSSHNETRSRLIYIQKEDLKFVSPQSDDLFEIEF
jgi:hypothetical protein